MIKNDNVLTKYNDIWRKIEKTSGIKGHSPPISDEKYMKAKVTKFSDAVNTNFCGDEVPKEGMQRIIPKLIYKNSNIRQRRKR